MNNTRTTVNAARAIQLGVTAVGAVHYLTGLINKRRHALTADELLTVLTRTPDGRLLEVTAIEAIGPRLISVQGMDAESKRNRELVHDMSRVELLFEITHRVPDTPMRRIGFHDASSNEFQQS